MKMRPVEGGLEIKPGETVTLKPGGFHLMLVDLKQPLEQGKTIKATLKFDKAGTLDVEYPDRGDRRARARHRRTRAGAMKMQGRRHDASMGHWPNDQAGRRRAECAPPAALA